MHIKHLKWLSLALLIGLLASCAPTVQGSKSYNAYDLSEDSAITVVPGSRWYFRKSWSAGDFNINLPVVTDDIFEKGSEGKDYQSYVFEKFVVESSALPEHWTLDLRDVKGIQTVTDRIGNGKRTRVQYRETIQLSFYIDVPADAQPGQYDATVVVFASSGGMETFSLPITVEPIMAGN